MAASFPAVPKAFDAETVYWPTGKMLNDLWDAIKARTPLDGDGIQIRPMGKDGYMIDASEVAAAGRACPFDGLITTVSTTQYFQLTQLGFLNNIIPSNMFSAGVLAAFAANDGDWVSLQATTADNAITAVSLIVTSSPPSAIGSSPGMAPTSFAVPLYYIDSATAYRVAGCGSLWASPEIALITDNPSPTCGGDPLERHYTWGIAQA